MKGLIDRIFLIVLDSFGVGELPDAALYGDAGSNTLRSVSKAENSARKVSLRSDCSV